MSPPFALTIASSYRPFDHFVVLKFTSLERYVYKDGEPLGTIGFPLEGAPLLIWTILVSGMSIGGPTDILAAVLK